MKAKVIGAMVAFLLAGWMAGTARADFILFGNEAMTVNTSHSKGTLFDHSKGTVVLGGSVTKFYSYDDSTVTIAGGSVGTVYAYDTSIVNVTGGNVTDELNAFDSSTVKMSGGSVKSLAAYNSANIVLSDGVVKYLGGGVLVTGNTAIEPTGNVNMSGGSVSYISVFGTQIVDISGGSVTGHLAVGFDAVVRIHGQNFHLTDGLSLDGDRLLGMSGTLYGEWFDGTRWSIDIVPVVSGGQGGRGDIFLVPEPATLSLLALGGLAIMRRRSKLLR